jgi:Protein of unknown function (DUF3467)
MTTISAEAGISGATMVPEQPPQNVEIVVPPEHQTGVYANVAAVSSQSPHDVTLDFIQMIPGSPVPSAVVVARLKLAPTFLMPLMQVLSNHLSQHEELQRRAEAGFPEPPSPDDEEES